MPEATLQAPTQRISLRTPLPADGDDCEEMLAQFAKAGIDVHALATQLQAEGAGVIRQVLERSLGYDQIEMRLSQSCAQSRGLGRQAAS